MSLHMLCTACIDRRTGGRPSCCMSRCNWDGGQWSWLLKKHCNWWQILVLACDPAMKWQSSSWVWEKSLQPKNFDSESLKLRSCWLFSSIGRELCTKNLYQKDRLLTLNSTEKGWMDFWIDFGAIGWTRLNEETGLCCMIHTSQLSSSSYLQRKGLLFFTTPPYQIWHLQTIFYSLKWNPNLRPLFWQHFRCPEQCDK